MTVCMCVCENVCKGMWYICVCETEKVNVCILVGVHVHMCECECVGVCACAHACVGVGKERNTSFTLQPWDLGHSKLNLIMGYEGG